MGKRQFRLSLAIAGGAAVALSLAPANGQQATGTATTTGAATTGAIPAGTMTAGQITAAGVVATPGAVTNAGTGSGFSVTLGVDTTLAYNDNLGLDSPSLGSTTRLDTTFNLGIRAETPLDLLQLDLGGVLRRADEPQGTINDFQDPFASLSYTRDGANSRLSAAASYREVNLNFFQPLIDLNLDGVIDEDDLVDDNGTRQRLTASVNLQTGLNDPLGFNFGLSHSETNYSDTLDPSLYDARTERASVGATLQFSPVTQGRVQTTYTDYSADDAPQTERQTTDISVGVTHELSPTTVIDASVGFTQIDETLTAINTTDDSEGTTASIGVVHQLSNGTVGATLDRTFNVNGERLTAQVSRALQLPSGNLSFSLGATRSDNGEVTAIGDLNYSHVLPLGQVNASIARRVDVSNLDNDVSITTARLGYSTPINNVSSIGMSFDYAQTQDAGAGNAADRERSNLRATYTRNLTADWDLTVGYQHATRKEGNQSTATDNGVFLTVQRQFNLKP